MHGLRASIVIVFSVLVAFFVATGDAHGWTNTRFKVLNVGVYDTQDVYAEVMVTYISGTNDAGLTVGQSVELAVDDAATARTPILATLMTATAFDTYMIGEISNTTTPHTLRSGYVVSDFGCNQLYINCQ